MIVDEPVFLSKIFKYSDIYITQLCVAQSCVMQSCVDKEKILSLNRKLKK